MSTFKFYFRLLITSGGIYSYVPHILYLISFSVIKQDQPKSHNLTLKFSSNKIFSGFISLCKKD